MNSKWKLYILSWTVLVYWIGNHQVDFIASAFPDSARWVFKTYWLPIDLFLLGLILLDFVRGNWDWGSGDSYGRSYVWHSDTSVEETSVEKPSEDAVELPDVAPNELKLMQCPKCGASLEFEEDAELTKCRHCGSQVARHIHRED